MHIINMKGNSCIDGDDAAQRALAPSPSLRTSPFIYSECRNATVGQSLFIPPPFKIRDQPRVSPLIRAHRSALHVELGPDDSAKILLVTRE